MTTTKTNTPPIAEVLGQVVAIWIISNAGLYLLSPILGTSYDGHPFAIAAYDLFWVGVTIFTFWNLYAGWKAIEMRVQMVFAVLLGLAGIIFYLLYVLPLFPPIHWSVPLEPPSEMLLSASQWYFLPKSIEIGLQQLLIAAMVLAFDARKFATRSIARWSAFLFGSIHLLLVFQGSSLGYVSVFTISAVAAGYIFALLLLRVRNGFVYSYFLQWGFYAVVIILARVLSVA